MTLVKINLGNTGFNLNLIFLITDSTHCLQVGCKLLFSVTEYSTQNVAVNIFKVWKRKIIGVK